MTKALMKAASAKDLELATGIVASMKPIDICLFSLRHPEIKDVAYWTARASEDLMFETAYLWSVTGKAPYPQAYEFGLDDADISRYQSKWREAGIEPTEIK